MKKTFPIISIALLLSGCYTTNKAKKQVIKAHAEYPQVTAKYCSEFYPTKDSVIIKKELIKGETITEVDSFWVDCDSIVKNNPGAKSNIKVPCPPSKNSFRVDTVYDSKEIIRENTARIANFEFQIKEKDTTIIKQGGDISFYKKFMWAFFGLLAVNGILIVLKIKKIFPF